MSGEWSVKFRTSAAKGQQTKWDKDCDRSAAASRCYVELREMIMVSAGSVSARGQADGRNYRGRRDPFVVVISFDKHNRLFADIKVIGSLRSGI